MQISKRKIEYRNICTEIYSTYIYIYIYILYILYKIRVINILYNILYNNKYIASISLKFC